MRWLFFSFLALHLLGVVVAYGTSVVAPFLRLQPATGGSRVAAGMTVVAERLSLPAALSMPFTGAAMVIVAGLNPTTQLWLWLSIVLYLGTLVYVIVRQRPLAIRLLRGERSAELMAHLRRGGLGVLAVVLVIAAMMIFKPGR